MSNDLGSNNTDERLNRDRESLLSEEANPRLGSDKNALENYALPDYLVEDDSADEDLFATEAASATAKGFYNPRPVLSRGFDASAYGAPAQPFNPPPAYPNNHPTFATTHPAAPATPTVEKKSRWSWLLPGRKSQAQNQIQERNAPTVGPVDETVPIFDPRTGEPIGMPAPLVAPPRFWEKQPYLAIAYVSAIAGTLAAAWLLGILAARIFPGSLSRPPLQESVLRKSSRFASGLWNLPQSWKTPPAETRIEAIPLPETGPVLEPVELSPIERQPLIDELNTVETELLTLDRRIQTIEKRLGRPPYQNTDIEGRINALRGAIDPPAKAEADPKYEPTPRDSQAALLAVAEHKITLPSDALFVPGDSSLKDSELLGQVLDQLINYPNATVVVRSYSDDRADSEAARRYTLAQASELSQYLARSLPEGYRWVSIGGGQSQPVVSNDSASSRQRNRRIEILVDTR